MNDLIVVENYVDSQCVRHLHLMSNFFINRPTACSEQGVLKQEAGVWHYWATYPYCGVLDIACVGNEKKFRRLVVWSLDGYGSVREALGQAQAYFWTLFKFRPGYAFMRKLPAAAENAQDVDGMVLLEANWMLEKSVAVGGRQ